MGKTYNMLKAKNLVRGDKMIMYTLREEAYILLQTIYGGLLIAFIYDIYRVLRGIFHPKKIATKVQDFIFWVIIFIVAFYVLIMSNNADIRFYNFLGFLFGSMIYEIILSKIIIRILTFIIKVLKSFILDLFSILKYPINVVFCILTGPYSYCKGRTKPLYLKVQVVKDLSIGKIKSSKGAISTYLKKK